MVAIAQGKPVQMGLREILRHYIDYRAEVVTRRTRFDLENARKREHILEGLMIAIQNIDEVIALIRASKTPKAAREGLMERFGLTEIQAQAILDLRLQRLTNMELNAIEREYAQIKTLIRELESILASNAKLRSVIKKELLEVRQRYAKPRQTQLLQAEATISIDQAELKTVEECAVLLLEEGKIRRVPKRLANQDTAVEGVLFRMDTATDRRLRLFTNQGSLLMLPVEDIPEAKPNARPVNLTSLLSMEADEKVIALMDDAALEEGDLYFYTTGGYAKRTAAAEYQTRMKRIAAISLKEGDAVLGVEKYAGDTILMVSRAGMSIRFETETVPPMGRVSAGVKCFKLDAHDSVVYAQQVLDEGELLVVTDRGYAKRSFIFDYDVQGRNGKGLKTFEFKKNGSNGREIAGALYVRDPYDFTVTQFHGTATVANTDHVLIEPRAGKGQLLVMAMLDDVVTGITKK